MIKINANSVTPTPWKNGGGITRDLWVTESFRISLADITQDGAFSPYEDCTRHFAVVEGEGVFLEFGYDSHRLTAHTPPFTFAGDNPPYCRLVNGETRDINMMIFKGEGAMSRTYNPRFSEKGFLALEEAGNIKRFDFIWYGAEKPPMTGVKGIWFGVSA
jgi:environmental stress-induced protein Ves